LRIFGKGFPPLGNGVVQSRLDHRIAMSFLTLGLISDNPIEIDDESSINTSFPNFIKTMNSRGAQIRPAPK
ncbi:MAG: 3-phosphoshikimate 1-carboxyvinyltransferase, partial [Rhodospirillales bacterium]|nr:3-phosphoshikimate 1-carboxyvinyltransferase [Rhodospirillales bacterium]